MTDIFEIQQLLLPFSEAGIEIQTCTNCEVQGHHPYTLTEVADSPAHPARWNHTPNYFMVCHECRANYGQCDRCAIYTTARVVTAEQDRICRPCAYEYRQCDECNLPTDYAIRIEGDHRVCQSCCDSNWYTCDDCRELVSVNDGHDCPNGTSEHIHDYSYTPVLNFLGDGPTYLGWELEISIPPEDIRNCADIAHDMLGYREDIGYLKEDGSITGFEMVTHPMSYTYAMRQFPWRLLRELYENGADGDSYEAGLHVHVSRAGFSNPSHIYRWLQFFYRNVEEIQRLARRDSQQWAAFSDSHRAEFLNFARGSRYGDRYQAINVLNRDTFEVRVFASSLDPRDVRAALALVAASVEYTRGLTCRDVMAGALNFSQFTVWVDARQDVYPDLFAQISEL